MVDCSYSYTSICVNSYIHLTVRILRKEPMNMREGVSKGLNRRFWMEKREEMI